MRKAILIKYPHDNDKRTWSTTVIGRTFCDNNSDLVQAMVLAADGLWYPQPQVDYEPWGYFSVKVLLGYRDEPKADFYDIALGLGGHKVLEPVDKLPEDVLWTSVRVDRI